MTVKRELLIGRFQQWLDSHPNEAIIAAECANIAEEYAAKEVATFVNLLLDHMEIIENVAEQLKDGGLSDGYNSGMLFACEHLRKQTDILIKLLK